METQRNGKRKRNKKRMRVRVRVRARPGSKAKDREKRTEKRKHRKSDGKGEKAHRMTLSLVQPELRWMLLNGWCVRVLEMCLNVCGNSHKTK